MRAVLAAARQVAPVCWLLAMGCHPSAEPAPAEPPSAEAAVFRGMLVHGHEVRELRPCDGGPTLWVVADADLWEIHRSLATVGDPYPEIYVELTGIGGPPPAEGFGADYPAQLTVTGLLFAHPAGEGHGCSETAEWIWRASGNEPFWSVTVTADRVTFRTPEDPTGPDLGDVRIETSEGTTTVAAGSAESALRLSLSEVPCRDGMSGAWYAWSARLAVGGRDLEGCARRGRALAG